MLHSVKFPHYERNMEKKGLKAFSLDFYLCAETYDIYGDESEINAGFSIDQDGKYLVTEYDTPVGVLETEYKVDPKTAKAFLNYAVHELQVPFWGEDLSDSEFGSDPFLDVIPEFRPDEIDEDAADIETDEEEEKGDPICTVSIDLNNGECREFSFYHEIHIRHEELAQGFMELLEDAEEVIKSPLHMLDDHQIDRYSKALAHYVFRMGVVEQFHSEGAVLSQAVMKTLNKDVHNRIAGLLTAIRDNRIDDVDRVLREFSRYGGDWDKAEPYMDVFDAKHND